MQTVFPLDLTQNFHRAPRFESRAGFLPVPIHSHRHDMNVASSDVVMPKNDAGLIAVSHLLHVLAGNRSKFIFGKLVFRMRIERNMEFLCNFKFYPNNVTVQEMDCYIVWRYLCVVSLVFNGNLFYSPLRCFSGCGVGFVVFRHFFIWFSIGFYLLYLRCK